MSILVGGSVAIIARQYHIGSLLQSKVMIFYETTQNVYQMGTHSEQPFNTRRDLSFFNCVQQLYIIGTSESSIISIPSTVF